LLIIANPAVAIDDDDTRRNTVEDRLDETASGGSNSSYVA